MLPLVFKPGTTRQTLKIDGSETIEITGVEAGVKPRMDVQLKITRKDGSVETVPVLCRIDTYDEIEYFKNGGVLLYVLRNLAKAA